MKGKGVVYNFVGELKGLTTGGWNPRRGRKKGGDGAGIN